MNEAIDGPTSIVVGCYEALMTLKILVKLRFASWRCIGGVVCNQLIEDPWASIGIGIGCNLYWYCWVW